MGRVALDKTRVDNEKKRVRFAKTITPLLFLKGYKDLSSSEICEIIGKSKATVYKYFSSSEEIICLAIIEKINEFESISVICDMKEKSVADRLELIFDKLGRFLNKFDPNHWNSVEKDHPKAYKKLLDAIKKWDKKILKLYREGITNKELYRFETKMMLHLDKSYVFALLYTNYLKEEQLTYSEAFRNYFNFKQFFRQR
jgi:AcrR family transcriptional regulator